ncbi:hypothetical protein DMENIID0001_072380 [Sergentomyia squamirostris]
MSSYETSSHYGRSSGSRHRDRDREDYSRSSRYRDEKRRTEKYRYEERRGRYSSRRSPSVDRYRHRSRDSRSRGRSRERYRSPSREHRRHRRESRERKKRSFTPERCPPSPPKHAADDSWDEEHPRQVKRHEENTVESNGGDSSSQDDFPTCNSAFNINDELLEDIEGNKEKIHQVMEERLRQHLAAQGKVYPPPKPEPIQTTMFANDGSFMEMFKKMQQEPIPGPSFSASASTNVATTSTTGDVVKKTPVPLFGKRRGGKILKTGIVEKKKPVEEAPSTGPTDAWSLYMMEVKKYKNYSCDIDNNSRPLVK